MNESGKNENSKNSDKQKSWTEKIKPVFKVVFQFTTKNPLKILVFFLHIVSFTTTLEGAKIILGYNYPAHLFAITIQLTLLILVLSQAAKESPIRKWFSVIFITAISIYASFFSFYNQLAGDQKTRNKETATKAHNALVSKIYTPINSKLNRLKNQEKDYDDQIEKESKGQGVTGVTGFGAKTSSLINKKQLITDEISKLAPEVDSAKGLSEIKVEEKTADEIFKHDDSAVSKISPDVLKRNGNPKVDKKNYIESDGIGFVTPYNKIIKKRDQNAIVSLFMALTIDGLALILSSAIDPHPSNLFMIFTGFCVYIIRGIKRSILTIFSTFRKEAEPYPTPEADGLKDSIIVNFLLDNKGSEFLIKFYESIDFQTHIIDINSLIKNEEDSTFKIGYRLLLDTMKCRPLRWIEIDSRKRQGGDSKEEQWRVSDTHYPSMNRWLARQISEQLHKEEWRTSGEFLLELEFPL